MGTRWLEHLPWQSEELYWSTKRSIWVEYKWWQWDEPTWNHRKQLPTSYQSGGICSVWLHQGGCRILPIGACGSSMMHTKVKTLDAIEFPKTTGTKIVLKLKNIGEKIRITPTQSTLTQFLPTQQTSNRQIYMIQTTVSYYTKLCRGIHMTHKPVKLLQQHKPVHFLQ